MTSTTRLNLPLIDASQAQKNVTHNEAILALDQLVQASVISQTLAAPPATSNDGDSYIVGPGATGAWVNKTGQIAAWQQGVWNFYPPDVGWLVWVVAQSRIFVWSGTAWVDAFGVLVQTLQGVALFGLGTTATSANPFSAKLNALLLTAQALSEGGTGDMRMVLNKSTTGNTVSQLYQDNYSGRAEVGLCGDDNLHIKVSPDGSTWTSAVTIAPTGVATLQQLALTSALSVANGGTGATTASAGRSGLGAAASGANADITSLSGLTTALSVAQGGTGVTTSTGTGANVLAINPTFTGGLITVSGGYGQLSLNKASSGGANVIYGQTNGVSRWDLILGDPTAESGANAGSNFILQALSDSGTYIANPLTITRATGVANFSTTPQIAGTSMAALFAGAGANSNITALPALTQATSFKNRLRNGTFAINQRAVSGTVTLAAGSYGHDGAKAGSSGCTYTFSTSGLDTTITISAGSLILPVEANLIEGGVYTVSNAGTAQVRIWQGTGSSGSGTYAGAPAAPTASPLTTPSLTAATQTNIEFSVGTILRPQFEPGTAATPFERRPPMVEMALCQRYFNTTYQPGTPPGSASRDNTALWLNTGYVVNPSYLSLMWNFPVAMCALPTVILYSPHTGTMGKAWIQNQAADVTAGVGQYNVNFVSVFLGAVTLSNSNDIAKWHATASAEI